jgi:N-acetylmuramate 1-kinase
VLQPGARRPDPGVAVHVLLQRVGNERDQPRFVLRQAGALHTLVNLAASPPISALPATRTRGSGYHHRMVEDDVHRVSDAAAALGLAISGIAPIAGDASRRSFYRLAAAGTSVVAAVYPEGAEEQLARDERVHAWGWERSLPIPRPLGHTALVAFAADLGDEDLERALRGRGERVLAGALETLAAFQACAWEDLETPRFDAAFFRRELEVFETFVCRPAGGVVPPAVSGFLDDLARGLAAHPYRLVHRDFHANNLFLLGAEVWAVDYQDMRGGPDTYDAVSLLRERAGGELFASDLTWRERAAARLAWPAGWERRYLECAAQRGLKVVGTFLRLASGGRPEYLAWLPRVRELARDAAVALAAPAELVDLLTGE